MKIIDQVLEIMERHQRKGAAMQPYFRAIQFDEPEHCHSCGQRILAGELIAEWCDSPLEYIHESCAEMMQEDAARAAAEGAAA